MSVTNKSKAQIIREQKEKEKQFQSEVVSEVSVQFHEMIDELHGMNMKDDYKIDVAIHTDAIEQMTDGKSNLRGDWNNHVPSFSPSGASSSNRDLFFKTIQAEEDDDQFEPYQKRWVRNGSQIHFAVQRDFLYIEKYMKDAPFELMRTKEGKPAWERNTRTVKQFEHNGEKFQIYGMMDGLLWYKPTKKRIGYDFKTKSTTIATVGDYKMKVPQENNVEQMVAYSLLFDLDEFIIHYESLAKDGWTKGKDARNDMKVFHLKITEDMKQELLDKFATVTKHVREKRLPQRDLDREFFSKYKELNAVLEEFQEKSGEPVPRIPTKDGDAFELDMTEGIE